MSEGRANNGLKSFIHKFGYSTIIKMMVYSNVGNAIHSMLFETSSWLFSFALKNVSHSLDLNNVHILCIIGQKYGSIFELDPTSKPL